MGEARRKRQRAQPVPQEFERSLSVTVGVPMYSGAALDPVAMANLMGVLMAGVSEGLIGSLSTPVGFDVDVARNMIVEDALRDGASHVLMIDADMVPEPTTLARLLSHRRPVVSAPCFMRTKNFDLAAWEDTPDGPVTLQELPRGLREVHGIGAACFLTETTVFRQMSQRFGDREWFQKTTDQGEDAFFCSRCREMDVRIYLDGAIDVGHVKRVIIGREAFEGARQPGGVEQP